jgi:hypothetical protein
MKMDVPFYPQKWNLSEWQKLGFESFAVFCASKWL